MILIMVYISNRTVFEFYGSCPWNMYLILFFKMVMIDKVYRVNGSKYGNELCIYTPTPPKKTTTKKKNYTWLFIVELWMLYFKTKFPNRTQEGRYWIQVLTNTVQKYPSPPECKHSTGVSHVDTFLYTAACITNAKHRKHITFNNRCSTPKKD